MFKAYGIFDSFYAEKYFFFKTTNVLILCLGTEKLRFPLFIIFRARVFEEENRLIQGSSCNFDYFSDLEQISSI